MLFNLGGPDSLDAVGRFCSTCSTTRRSSACRPPLRWLLAALVSSRRAPVARDIYAQIGGASPLLPQTRDQARALERRLDEHDHGTRDVFVCMRYWHPMSDAVAAEVKAFAPDQIVLLPLYPQFSTTTTASSLEDWSRAAAKAGLNVPTRRRLLLSRPCRLRRRHARAGCRSADRGGRPVRGRFRLLFSAHGLPKRVIAAGDPYQWQVEQTVAAVVAQLGGLAAIT